MRIAGTAQLLAPPEVVYDNLQDGRVLAATIPGVQSLEQLELPGVDQELPDDGLAEVAVRLLGKTQVQEILRIAQEREIVLGAAAAVRLRRIREQVSRLAEQVERDVGEREILLERRRVADPLAETLRQDQARVADSERVRTHRFLTSSGMS